MQRGTRHYASIVVVLLLAFSASVPVASGKRAKNSAVPGEMSPRKRAVHALNRLTFGPRPADLDRVMAMGVDNWIDEQLHPEKISDNAMDNRLAPLRTLRMDTREIVETFPPRQLIKAVESGKMDLPSDPAKRAVYESQIDRREQKQERKKFGGTGQ